MKKIVLLTCLLAASSVRAGEIVVIENPAATAISKQELVDLYLGNRSHLTVLDQPDGLAIYAEFYQKLTGRSVSQIRALWSRLIFTNRGHSPKQLTDSAAVRKAVAADPKAIGYIEKSYVDSSIKVMMSID
jgi:ABC-type phosphate transport system substrate-binding protein